MIGILLINLGTPDAPTTPAVRRYLRQFLSDPLVIDIHPILRFLLLRLIILPFRSPKSAEAYQKIWTKEGSPLLIHTQKLAQEVACKLGNDYAVEVGMRYGNPSIKTAMQKLVERGASEIRVLPLFPQYAESSTETAIAEVKRIYGGERTSPLLRILPPFYNHPGFIQSFVEKGRPILEKTKPDQVIFSFHGLPERHLRKLDFSGNHCFASEHCCDDVGSANAHCYRAQCFSTARLIAQDLGLKNYLVSFQSRLGRTPWIKPYTDLEIIRLAQSGKKRFVVFSPAFVADCLETLEEIGIRARESALAHGAEVLELVPSLNAYPRWVEAVYDMIG